MSDKDPTRRRTTEKQRKFYVFGPRVAGGSGGHGLVFENEKQLCTPPRLIVRPAEGGFPALREKPRIVQARKGARPTRDLEDGMSGYWLVSQRLKQVFERADPEGFAFAECDFILKDGSIGPTYFLCDITRQLDALDVARSNVKIRLARDHVRQCDVEMYSTGGGGSLKFKPEIVGEAHVFVPPRMDIPAICDSILRDACKNITGLTGVSFYDAEKL